jgi:hypothetical protein
MATKDKAASKEVATTDDKAVAVVDTKSNLPAEFLAELEADGEEFREPLTQDDMAMPFLQILQSLSPQAVEGDPAYVEGAKAGMLFNTVTGEVIDGKNDGIEFVSIAYKSSFIEWVTRVKGGGFVAEYDVAKGSAARTARNDQNLDIILDGSPVGTPGNQLNSTHTHYVMVVGDDGVPQPAILTMTSTQLKSSKQLNYMVDALKIPGTLKRAPRFYGRWLAKTELKKNDHGSWYVWKFTGAGTLDFNDPMQAALYAGAKEFAASIKDGEAAADYSKADATSEVPSETIDDDSSDDVPF